MQEKQLDKESMKGTIYVLLSAVCFSTGGVLIKSIPWSSITIQGIRSIFSFMLIASYMVITKRKFVWNKTVLFGAVCNTYALVMMMKGFPGADFESSLLASHVISLSIGLPSFLGETDHSAKAWICIILLGVIQFGLSYIFLSRGLDRVSPVTASLTSTLEPILNPILVAIFCGETIGRTAVIGAVLVIGAAACYNVYEAAQFVNQ